MATFPTSIPSYAGFTSSHTLSADNHASQHNSEQADIVAIATKMGTGVSTPTASKLLRATGTGTSTWAQADLTTDVTGILPVANGGTGTGTSTGTGSTVLSTSPNISTPTINTPTILSGGSWAGSPTITTPTIGSFTNSQHTHQNAAGGGQVDPRAFNNPYKFLVQQAGAANTGNGAFAQVPFDTEVFDTNNNVVTGTYTVPLNGYYFFGWGVSAHQNSAGDIIASLYVNGVETFRGARLTYSAGTIMGSTGSSIINLSAGNTVDVRIYGSTTGALDVGLVGYNFFSGFLMSVL